ncbi:nucleotidyltransferase domain-containing protein [Alicyclobacillus sp. ALC3]|uniref:nucleotidyltransferase domain-containing protein n=1 Tax=Alicyclobacillus sp. ALC3 TaxID=2796143 RepID=UPI0023785B1A|nr:nucleotidyltransferase domain-containing protein [Alicyclobacillus sp. ALC3]WDL99205.1 nucleotidyltransferase domain-containing protein [Alicyclobacillus sp. ALC3]
MVTIPEEIKAAVIDYVQMIERDIPVSKAIIFGSFAKGHSSSDSDVDVAIFSDYFESISRVEGITYLLRKAVGCKVDLEPVAFTNKEFEERLGIVDEIVQTGIEIHELM